MIAHFWTSRHRVAILAALALGGCNLAPAYHRPASVSTGAFKEAPGWSAATPSDAVAKGEWWRLFDDPVLNDLEARVAVNNQNVAAAAAAYEEARAAVREARAALFPTIDLSAGVSRSGSFGHGTTTVISTGGTTGATGTSIGTGVGTGTGLGTGVDSGTGAGTTTGVGTTGTTIATNTSSNRRYSVTLGASWEPDLWGRIRNGVNQQRALAEASAADLANATLSARGELAADYLQLRGIEHQKAILDATVSAYSRALRITTNRYDQGVVARVDVLQAQTQLDTARANAGDLERQRAAFEHAIAVLAGENPSTFGLAAAAWSPTVPEVPANLPSDLLQRRPDIAGAERRVAAANANIGIQRAAFFPSLGLSGDIGTQASRLGSLFSAASSIWSVGLTAAETLLDFGARSARVTEARAQSLQTVASYRQTVLTAVQQVEDELAAAHAFAYVSAQRSSAAAAANRVEVLTQNQYLVGQIAYSDVIVAQTTALAARQNEAAAMVDRQIAAVSLIQALGGSWAGPAPTAAPMGIGQ